MLLLFFGTQGLAPAAGYINAGVVVGDIWPPLNAVSASDSIFWTDTEMYDWFNQAARRLSGRAAVFVVRDASLTTLVNTPLYTLPDSHQATIQADLAGLVLRPRNVQELEALDVAWPATVGPPEAFILDELGVKMIALYPQADGANAGKSIGLVIRSIPPDVSISAGFLTATPALSEYFTFYILGEARAKEGRAQMPEISQWFRGLCRQLEQVVAAYLGES